MSLFSRRWIAVIVLVSLGAKALSVRTSHRRVVVVGKVIIDEYRSPVEIPSDALVSIGGGGPQAAWSAAAALAILSDDEQDPPSPQPVTFLGLVGGIDWTEQEDAALHDILGPAIDCIHLLSGESLRTPRIQLWHDENQTVQWTPLHNSLGPQGASGLWRRPTPDEFLNVLDDSEIVTCFAIVEGGENSPGDGYDSFFLSDPTVQGRVGYLGVEPVVFADEKTGIVSAGDASTCAARLESISDALDFVSPDMPLFRAIDTTLWDRMEAGVRNGPGGSIIRQEDGNEWVIPAATLMTEDGKPVNPTGAGNAYAAAFTACRGNGSSLIDAGCIATAIGAVFCEYVHIPPWTTSILRRIRQASKEVGSKVTMNIDR